MSTTMRVGSALLPGYFHVGDRGRGVLGSSIPSTGEHGPAIPYPGLSLPADAGAEIMVSILSVPGALTLFQVDELGRVTAEGPAGSHVGNYRLWADGVDRGTSTYTVQIGGGVVSGGVALDDVAAGGGATSAPSGTLSGAAALQDVQVGGGGSTPSGNVSGDAALGDVQAGGGASSQPSGTIGGNASLDDVAAAGGGSMPSGSLSGDGTLDDAQASGGASSLPSGTAGGNATLDDAAAAGGGSTPSGNLAGGATLDDGEASGGATSVSSGTASGAAKLDDGDLAGSVVGGGPSRPPTPVPFYPVLRRTVRYSVADPQEVRDLSPIEPGETITIEFVFSPFATVSAPAIDVQRLRGSAGVPDLVITGGLVIVDGNVVLQRFTCPAGNGALGHTFRLSATVTAVDGSRITASGRLPVGKR